MQRQTRAATALASLALAGLCTVPVAKAAVLFSDTFDRGGWENAMTNAFLPAWSEPTANFIYTLGTYFDVEVRVTGPTFTILVNGSPVFQATDADLRTGSVGVLSWGNRNRGSGGDPGTPYGLECPSLSVEDENGATLLNYAWGSLIPDWRRVTMRNSAGTAFGSYDGLGFDPTDGCVRENTNGYSNAIWNNTDFMGPSMVYTGAGSDAWTDYEVRARLYCLDNDGFGFLLRCQDDSNFYRVMFVSEAWSSPPPTWRAPQGVSVQRCRKGVWKEVFRDTQYPGVPLFAYTPGTPFDVSATIRTAGATAEIDITIVHDPGGPGQTTIVVPTIVDAAAEPLDTDVDGDGEFEPAEGDVFSGNDTNANGRWDAAEAMVTDVDGDHVFEPADGDVFSANDTNKNGRWDPGEPLATDVDGDGVFDPADGDVFDTRDANRNGQWDPAEPMDLDVDGDHVFDAADGDVFDANDQNNNGQWDGAPIPAGSAGLTVWGQVAGNTLGTERGARFTAYGGAPSDFVRTPGGATLLGNIFVPTLNTDYVPGSQQAGSNQAWTIRVRDGVLMENSDGRQRDGGAIAGGGGTGTPGDGWYQPYYLYKGGFNAGENYTLRARLRNNYDNDGIGLIFGYVDSGNMFRVGFRQEGTGNYGFRQGVSVQKIVNGQITQLFRANPTRSNLAGVWVQKLQTMTIEQADNENLPDGSGKPGVEFQGPQLVRGDAAWTDYTWEAVIDTHDDDGIGLLFRFQDERNFYRLNFEDERNGTETEVPPPASVRPPRGISVQKVVNGVWSEIFRDTDDTYPGDNDLDPMAGFKYFHGGLAGTPPTPQDAGYRIWRARLICTGNTFRLEIDGIDDTGMYGDWPNFYAATFTDGAPDALLHGKVGIHAWGHNANEFREMKLTLAGQSEPAFTDGMGIGDPKGWIDATDPAMSDPAVFTGGVEYGLGNIMGAGTPFSGIGLRPDLKAIGARDNRWISGTTFIIPGDYTRGTTDFDGPRAVAGSAGWTDYEYSVDLRAFDDDGIGVLFRYQDEDNFYRLMFMSQAGNTWAGPPQGVSVQKRAAGGWAEVFFDNSFIYSPGERWNVKVKAKGGKFDIKVTQLDGDIDGDGKTVYDFTFTDPAPLLTGKIGVTAWGAEGQADEVNSLLRGAGLPWTSNFDEGAVFDNVVVSTLCVGPDLDCDGDVDVSDFATFQVCFNGPGNPPPAGCTADADFDDDNDVDVNDFATFQVCFNGPGNAPACGG